MLPWVPEFCLRAATRVAEPLYAAALLLTAELLSELRDALERATGLARDIRPLPGSGKQQAPAPDDEDAAYVPGLAPSW